MPALGPPGETTVSTESHELEATRPPRSRSRLWLFGAGVLALGVLAAWLASRAGERGTGAGEIQPTPVRAARVERGDLRVVSAYPGELVGEVADIAPKVSGLLQDVPVRIGDRVERGDVVAVIDDVDLRAQLQEAEGQLRVAEANGRRASAELEGVEADHRRSADLYREQLLSDQEFDQVMAKLATTRASLAAAEAQIEQARARVAVLRQQFADTRVVAPFSGTVAARYLDRGALVQQGTPILRLVEEAPLVVQFRVPERDLGAVRSGVELTVTTQATGSESVRGWVRRISGEVSRSDRTALVEGELESHVELLRPGMYAQVRLQVAEVKGGRIVAGQAVLKRVDLSGVEATGLFTVAAEDQGEVARWTPVQVLGQAGERVAIDGAVAVGDWVLTLGHGELRDGSPVRVVQREGEGGAPAAAEPQEDQT